MAPRISISLRESHSAADKWLMDVALSRAERLPGLVRSPGFLGSRNDPATQFEWPQVYANLEAIRASFLEISDLIREAGASTVSADKVRVVLEGGGSFEIPDQERECIEHMRNLAGWPPEVPAQWLGRR